MSESKEVANWDEELAKAAKQVSTYERPQLARISTRGGVLTYLEQKMPGNQMEVIVLSAIVEQAWYPGKFDPNNPTAPDCFGFSETGEEMVPHEKSFNKQAETCDRCDQNQWGSDKNSPSGRGKACKRKRRLLLMHASAANDGSIPTAELATLDVPVMSVANWGTYVMGLNAAEGLPYWAVKTRIYTESDPRAQFKVRFEYKGPLDRAQQMQAMRRSLDTKYLLMIPYEKTEQGLNEETKARVSNKKY